MRRPGLAQAELVEPPAAAQLEQVRGRAEPLAAVQPGRVPVEALGPLEAPVELEQVLLAVQVLAAAPE